MEPHASSGGARGAMVDAPANPGRAPGVMLDPPLRARAGIGRACGPPHKPQQAPAAASDPHWQTTAGPWVWRWTHPCEPQKDPGHDGGPPPVSPGGPVCVSGPTMATCHGPPGVAVDTTPMSPGGSQGTAADPPLQALVDPLVWLLQTLVRKPWWASGRCRAPSPVSCCDLPCAVSDPH